MRMIHIGTLAPNQPTPEVSIRCPSCLQIGMFHAVQIPDLQVYDGGTHYWVGLRSCPNQSCKLLLYHVRENNAVIATYPPEVIDFDATNLPAPVNAALSEAITCHANECYVAAAIMVRKTLEELCADREAVGSNLQERIEALRDKVVIPQDLLDGAHDLRLLGNDAAHIESREYEQVGREEVDVGIEFTKELLKAVYQMSALLARLRALRASQQSD